MSFTLADLETILAARALESAEVSYTARLLQGGAARAAKKLGEEAVETVIAAISESEEALVKESADVLYHLMVVLNARGVAVQAVMQELEQRTQQSGLEEKAGRGK